VRGVGVWGGAAVRGRPAGGPSFCAAVPGRGIPRKFLRSCWAGEGLWACQEGQMGRKLVRFGSPRPTRSRQGASIEVHEAGRIRPSSGYKKMG
jgi:hypothetical protein